MSEKTVKPQTPALPVGKGPESRKTVPSRKPPALPHLQLQGQTEGGSGCSGGDALFKAVQSHGTGLEKSEDWLHFVAKNSQKVPKLSANITVCYLQNIR